MILAFGTTSLPALPRFCDLPKMAIQGLGRGTGERRRRGRQNSRAAREAKSETLWPAFGLSASVENAVRQHSWGFDFKFQVSGFSGFKVLSSGRGRRRE